MCVHEPAPHVFRKATGCEDHRARTAPGGSKQLVARRGSHLESQRHSWTESSRQRQPPVAPLGTQATALVCGRLQLRSWRCLMDIQAISACAAAVMLAMGLAAMGCDASVEEPVPVRLPVVTASEGLTVVTNDRGWQVELERLVVALADLEFTIEGETHARLRRARELVLARAWAHPGHYAGGEVTGELTGQFLVDLAAPPGRLLGQASLLPGAYHGLNLTFRAATAADLELAACGRADGASDAGSDATSDVYTRCPDELLGHSAWLSGRASRDGRTIEFVALLDVAPATQMVGGPFDLIVGAATTATLGLTAYTRDPSEGDTLFDGLDFGALDADSDQVLAIVPGQAAHNILARTFVRHDHWGIAVDGTTTGFH